MTEATESTGTPWWVRIRSAVLLIALLVLLGVAAAAALGVVVLAVATLMDRALG